MNSLGSRLLVSVAALAVFVTWAAQAGEQSAKTPLAKVTVSGKRMATVNSDDGTKKDRYVLLEEDNSTTIRVGTDQDVAKFVEEVLAEHTKLVKAYQATVQKLVEKQNLDAIKKADKEFKAASDELIKNMDTLTAVGTVAMEGSDLRLNGKLRVYDYKGVDKDLGKGKALVEGEATKINYDTGQGEKMILAIENGAKAIVLTGKAAENLDNAKGTIRALGVLRAGKNGHPVLEAEKVEALKK